MGRVAAFSSSVARCEPTGMPFAAHAATPVRRDLADSVNAARQHVDRHSGRQALEKVQRATDGRWWPTSRRLRDRAVPDAHRAAGSNVATAKHEFGQPVAVVDDRLAREPAARTRGRWRWRRNSRGSPTASRRNGSEPSACRRDFDDLVYDNRGTRKGFPPDVLVELLALRDYYYGYDLALAKEA